MSVNSAINTGNINITTLGTIGTGTWQGTAVSAVYGGTGVASPTAHTLPIAAGSSNFTFLTLTNGQLLIGSTGADPVPATLTGGTGISIATGAGSITISSTGEIPYTEVTGTTQLMLQDNEYTANNASLVTLTLPSISSVGAKIQVNWKGAGGWKIAQNAGQQIQFGNVITTSGTGGSLASSASGDCVKLVCITAPSLWEVQSVQGSLTVV